MMRGWQTGVHLPPPILGLSGSSQVVVPGWNRTTFRTVFRPLRKCKIFICGICVIAAPQLRGVFRKWQLRISTANGHHASRGHALPSPKYTAAHRADADTTATAKTGRGLHSTTSPAKNYPEQFPVKPVEPEP
jgi:hypothetical protein